MLAGKSYPQVNCFFKDLFSCLLIFFLVFNGLVAPASKGL
uniref:Uncharacterized protein n=4 Tax=Vibrio TaxID=662 RepID=A0A0H3ZV53_9VIBR|nr:hypothetical protein [Vibrio sp. ZF_53]AKN37416.1 hypothetical protein [Vibrio tasmaniensis]AKN39336.1 hypothetical protein [Vibrio sp. ZF_45]AKN39744.1 hypothetical protein [Vibrio splendidus]